MEWQPIETAPTDQWVYTWGPDEGHGIARFNMNDGAEWERATHWMPLPEAPALSPEIGENDG